MSLQTAWLSMNWVYYRAESPGFSFNGQTILQTSSTMSLKQERVHLSVQSLRSNILIVLVAKVI